MYSQKVMECFMNPQNVGIENVTGLGPVNRSAAI